MSNGGLRDVLGERLFRRRGYHLQLEWIKAAIVGAEPSGCDL